MNLLIVGAGGHGRCCYEIAERMFVFNQIDFIDDHAKEVLGKQVVGKVSDLETLKSKYDAVCIAIGNNEVRKDLMVKAKNMGYQLPCLIDPQAMISTSCIFKEGTVIFPQAVLESCCQVGMGCIISSNATINHDAVIEDFVLVYSNSVVRPTALIESLSRIGSHCVISFGERVNAKSDIADGMIVRG